MRKHVTRSLAAAAVLAATVAIGLPGGAPAATTGACVLGGQANVSPGLTTTTKSISYTFTGTFSNCQGTGAVKRGTVTASGSGTGSCSGNATHGTASITWNTGATSSVSFTTKGTGSLVNVAGTITSGKFAGSKANANLVFSTGHPQACLGTGLTDPKFNGDARIGI